jgi:glycerophosphoryl diester phosphodiesterase
MAIPIIAHRACLLDAPENSILGIKKAAELGADGVEVDSRQTLDGKPVLMHDSSPWRTTRLPGLVRLYLSAFLCNARLRGSNERVPLLKDALEAMSENLFMAMELKDASCARPALRMVRQLGMEERVKLWSYREGAVRYFSREAPDIEVTLLRDDIDPEGLRRYLDDAVEWGARGISPHWSAVNPQFVAQAHERGLTVYSMNRDLESVPRKVAAGLDGIVTDHPRQVREMLEASAVRT